MKRFTLLVMLLCLMAVSFGQVQRKVELAVTDQNAADDRILPAKSLKGGGDVIWETSFNWVDATNPSGWSLPDGWTIKDVSDTGFPWFWVKDTLKYMYNGVERRINPPSFFETKDDGFLSLPIMYYNQRDGLPGKVPADSYIETPKIDCSAVSSIVVKFTQSWNVCCLNENVGNLEMLVSVDNFAHFATYDQQYNVGGNITIPVRYRNVEVNISEFAGSPDVQIRFYFHGGNYLYYWMIDDLKLVEAYNYNLALDDYWADANVGADQGVGFINYWPLSLMGMDDTKGGKIGSYQFKGAILNMGIQDQEEQKLNLQVLRNGQEVLNQNSVALSLWSRDRDTLSITDPYLADDYGDYQFKFTAVGDVADEQPSNNTALLSFTVNDTLYHRATFSEIFSSNGDGWVDGNNAGDMVGVGFDIAAPCEYNSIYALIADIDSTASTQFQYVLFKDMGADGFAELSSSEVLDATQDMVWSWQNLSLTKDGETEFLTPGFYVACVRMWGTKEGDTDGINGMSVGWDKDTKFTGDYSFLWRNFAGLWWSIDKLNQIGLVINAKGGPTQAPVTFNVDMSNHIANGEFKPGIDVVEVIGLAPTWNSTVAMTDPENDGIYTVTVENLTIAGVLNYKYGVNGTPEAYPLTGNPYRKWTVRYWNNTDDTYNGGVTTGVDPTSLTVSFSVYPNPTAGAFHVEITNAAACDLVITLSNIQGQVIYRNAVSKAVSHRETIDNKLSKGIYFLTVNNGKKVEVRKVVVQ